MALVIRPAQMEVFRRAAIDRFVFALMDELQGKTDGESRRPNPELESSIRTGLRIAQQYGFEYERHVAAFIILLLRHCDASDLEPPAEWAPILVSGQPASLRLRRIRKLAARTISSFGAHA